MKPAPVEEREPLTGNHKSRKARPFVLDPNFKGITASQMNARLEALGWPEID